MITKEDIKEWLSRAKSEHTHMLVVCDQFDYEDYPVFINKSEDAKTIANRYNGQELTKVMEVYNLSMSLEDQLCAGRVFNF